MQVSTILFKAYDIRGHYPDVLNEEIVRAVARAYASEFKPQTVVVGRDVRRSSPALAVAVIAGLVQSGVEVIDVGVITTDQLYFVVGHFGFDGGIVVSASHNPPEDNGMKFVTRGVVPVGLASGLDRIRDRVLHDDFVTREKQGSVREENILEPYLAHVYSFIDRSAIKPLRVFASGFNGAVGPLVRRIASDLKLTLVELNLDPDGSFPKGQPDPFQPRYQEETCRIIKTVEVDLGVAWDGDADRFFLVETAGVFVPGSLTTVLLARILLARNPGATILTDTRVIWPVREAVTAAGGRYIANAAGHTLIKERMRREDALFAGELSGHFFFRDNWYADNGIIPFLLMLELLSRTGDSLTDLVRPLRERYAFSGEINRTVKDPAQVIELVAKHFADHDIDRTDGISVESSIWRFNLRASNTEPLLRLNVEGYDQLLVDEKRDEILAVIQSFIVPG